jgi:hypothetical protein
MQSAINNLDTERKSQLNSWKNETAIPVVTKLCFGFINRELMANTASQNIDILYHTKGNKVHSDIAIKLYINIHNYLTVR